MFVEIALKIIFVVLAIIACFSLIQWLDDPRKEHYLAAAGVLSFILSLIIFAISNIQDGVTQKQLKNAIEKCGAIENIESIYYVAPATCINPQVEKE